MPTYCYKVDGTDEVVEEILSFAEKDERERNGKITLPDGRAATRDYGAEYDRSRQIKAAWPMFSRALAVHPNQIKEAKEYARHRGVDVDFDSRGHVKLDSPSHRRKYMKIRGVHDEDSFC